MLGNGALVGPAILAIQAMTKERGDGRGEMGYGRGYLREERVERREERGEMREER